MEDIILLNGLCLNNTIFKNKTEYLNPANESLIKNLRSNMDTVDKRNSKIIGLLHKVTNGDHSIICNESVILGEIVDEAMDTKSNFFTNVAAALPNLYKEFVNLFAYGYYFPIGKNDKIPYYIGCPNSGILNLVYDSVLPSYNLNSIKNFDNPNKYFGSETLMNIILGAFETKLEGNLQGFPNLATTNVNDSMLSDYKNSDFKLYTFIMNKLLATFDILFNNQKGKLIFSTIALNKSDKQINSDDYSKIFPRQDMVLHEASSCHFIMSDVPIFEDDGLIIKDAYKIFDINVDNLYNRAHIMNDNQNLSFNEKLLIKMSKNLTNKILDEANKIYCGYYLNKNNALLGTFAYNMGTIDCSKSIDFGLFRINEINSKTLKALSHQDLKCFTIANGVNSIMSLIENIALLSIQFSDIRTNRGVQIAGNVPISQIAQDQFSMNGAFGLSDTSLISPMLTGDNTNIYYNLLKIHKLNYLLKFIKYIN